MTQHKPNIYDSFGIDLDTLNDEQLRKYLTDEELADYLLNKSVVINEVFKKNYNPNPDVTNALTGFLNLDSYFRENEFTPFLVGEVLWEFTKDSFINKPIPFTDFCRDPYFLGETLTKGHFPLWEGLGELLYPHPLFSPYYECILETPIGSAKSTFAMSVLLYEIYKTQEIRQPQLFYELLAPTVISLTVMAPDLNLAGDVNWNILEGFIANSDYFRSIVSLPKGKKAPGELEFPKNITLRFASKPIHLVGRAIIGGAGDEVNVSRYIQSMYRDILNRMESRFPIANFGGIYPGKLLLLSSPKDDGSFTAERLHEDKPFSIAIQNIPIWHIRVDTKYSGDTFEMFIGNKSKEPFIIKSEKQKTPDIIHEIMSIPIELYDRFEQDPTEGLREFAGVRTAGKGLLFRSSEALDSISTAPNICDEEIITLDFDDPLNKIINHFPDLSYFTDPIHPESYRFLHIDVGINNDMLGFACAHGIEKEISYFDKQTGEQLTQIIREPHLDFAFALKKPANEEICVPKLIDFILYLKEEFHYPIHFVTTDNYEGRVLRQYLRLHQILTDHLSLEDYIVWKLVRSIMLFKRCKIPYLPFFIKQCIHLEDTGKKYDHPKFFKDNTKGSHDLAQAVFGAIYNVLTAKLIMNETSFMKELGILSKSKQMESSFLDNISKQKKGNLLGNFTSLNKFWGMYS